MFCKYGKRAAENIFIHIWELKIKYLQKKNNLNTKKIKHFFKINYLK